MPSIPEETPSALAEEVVDAELIAEEQTNERYPNIISISAPALVVSGSADLNIRTRTPPITLNSPPITEPEPEPQPIPQPIPHSIPKTIPQPTPTSPPPPTPAPATIAKLKPKTRSPTHSPAWTAWEIAEVQNRERIEGWLEEIYQARVEPWGEGGAFENEGMSQEQLVRLQRGRRGGGRWRGRGDSGVSREERGGREKGMRRREERSDCGM